MGGVSVDTGGKGGKKSVDTTVNLVPFIDLLCSLIAFLMMTAVWTQVGKLQVASQGMNSDTVEPPKPTLQINLLLTEMGYTLTAGNQLPIPKKDGSYDQKKLLEQLKAIKTDNPDQRTITVQAEDAIEYEHLVRAVDLCLEADLPDVSVSPAI